MFGCSNKLVDAFFWSRNFYSCAKIDHFNLIEIFILIEDDVHCFEISVNNCKIKPCSSYLPVDNVVIMTIIDA